MKWGGKYLVFFGQVLNFFRFLVPIEFQAVVLLSGQESTNFHDFPLVRERGSKDRFHAVTMQHAEPGLFKLGVDGSVGIHFLSSTKRTDENVKIQSRRQRMRRNDDKDVREMKVCKYSNKKLD